MAYDPELGGDPSLVLSLANGMFAGHVRKDTPCVDRIEPGGWRGRAMAVILLYPEGPKGRQGRCGIVDLTHESERDTPRCGNPDCRCMTAPWLSAEEG